jgi:glutathione S-transferase
MMKLYYQTHSPFASKALVFAHEAGLADRIEVINHETSPTRHNETVLAENRSARFPSLSAAATSRSSIRMSSAPISTRSAEPV